jgi:hypothetical protein
MFERLLEPGCTESPACQCGGEMQIAAIETLPQGSDAAVRIYRCDKCEREMRLTVWAAPPAASEWQRLLGSLIAKPHPLSPDRLPKAAALQGGG